MCGRYVLATSGEAVQAAFGLSERPALTPRYNIAPSQAVPAVLVPAAGAGPVLTDLRWGLLPGWARGEAAARRPINARSETVAGRPMFRQAFRRRRCLLPADGWYEWEATATGRQPWFLHDRGGALLAFAGLWETATGPDGQPLHTCAILTTEAGADVAHVHDRMPVLLRTPQSRALWLDPAVDSPGTLLPLLAPAAAGTLAAHRVSRRVNNPRHDDALCVVVDEAPPDTA